MTAFEAYWLALKAGFGRLRTALRTFWRARNADHSPISRAKPLSPPTPGMADKY